MSQTATVAIDKKRLDEALVKRNLNRREVSTEMGLEASYLTNCSGKVSKVVKELLEYKFHIPYKEYAPVNNIVPVQKKEAEVDKPIQIQSAIDYDKLGRVIASAVYEAVSKAWNEPAKKEDIA